MTLDDLMEVWRSQDAAPLHGVNETLLRLALRRDEANLRAARRREDWIIYLLSAIFTVAMAAFTVITFGMLFYNDDDVIVGWDLVVPVVGAVAALLMSVALYLKRRTQALREQRFGDSLRDQVARRIAQLDDLVTTQSRHGRMLFLAIFVVGLASVIAGRRVNMEPNEAFTGWLAILRVSLIFTIIWVVGRRAARRRINQDVLPRKRRLEALLKELDG
jgi:hypothetical protein